MKAQPRNASHNAAALKRVRLAAKILDGVIPVPGTGQKVGIDPIIGLLTGGGDSIGFIMSGAAAAAIDYDGATIA